jgi:hypothetical protein
MKIIQAQSLEPNEKNHGYDKRVVIDMTQEEYQEFDLKMH